MTNAIPMDVIIGVDTHKDVHAAAAISGAGVHLATTTVPASSKGYGGALEAWAKSMGAVQAFGIEGTGSYGAGLSRFLRERGHTVVEVNRPNRQLRYQQGKSDAVDAESAARAVLAGQAVGQPKSGTGAVEMIRHLKIARDTAVKARTQAMQTLKAIIVCSPDALREQLDQVSGKMTLLRRLVALRPGPLTSTLASAKASLRAIARRWLLLDAEIKQHDAHLETLTAARAEDCWRRTESPRALRPRCCCLSATTLSASTRRQHSPSCAAPARSRHQAARPSGTASTVEATGRPTPPSIG